MEGLGGVQILGEVHLTWQALATLSPLPVDRRNIAVGHLACTGGVIPMSVNLIVKVNRGQLIVWRRWPTLSERTRIEGDPPYFGWQEDQTVAPFPTCTACMVLNDWAVEGRPVDAESLQAFHAAHDGRRAG